MNALEMTKNDEIASLKVSKVSAAPPLSVETRLFADEISQKLNSFEGSIGYPTPTTDSASTGFTRERDDEDLELDLQQRSQKRRKSSTSSLPRSFHCRAFGCEKSFTQQAHLS